jgi:hypothetical protein
MKKESQNSPGYLCVQRIMINTNNKRREKDEPLEMYLREDVKRLAETIEERLRDSYASEDIRDFAHKLEYYRRTADAPIGGATSSEEFSTDLAKLTSEVYFNVSYIDKGDSHTYAELERSIYSTVLSLLHLDRLVRDELGYV